jgi:hypothetical protein
VIEDTSSMARHLEHVGMMETGMEVYQLVKEWIVALFAILNTE